MSGLEERLGETNFVIVAHRLYHGVCDDLEKYLVDHRCRNLWFIGHEFSALETRRSFIRHFRDGKLEYSRYSRDYGFLPEPLVNVKDFLYTICWMLARVRKPDLYFGFGSFNALPGTLLQRAKGMKAVIFYTIDYAPVRFGNRLLNALYHLFDRFELRHATETWNLSPRMAEAREELKGLSASEYPRQIVVPVGLWFKEIKRYGFDEVNRTELVFVGHLLEKQGVQLILKATPRVIEEIPGFTFKIIGSGDYEGELKRLSEELGIAEHVSFEGPIFSLDLLNDAIARSALAVAMYDMEADDYTRYADPTKIKTYLSVGLPILTTEVPYNARQIEERRCGKIIEYDERAIALAVIELMKDEDLLREYRQNVEGLARELDWDVIFRENLGRLL